MDDRAHEPREQYQRGSSAERGEKSREKCHKNLTPTVYNFKPNICMVCVVQEKKKKNKIERGKEPELQGSISSTTTELL